MNLWPLAEFNDLLSTHKFLSRPKYWGLFFSVSFLVVLWRLIISRRWKYPLKCFLQYYFFCISEIINYEYKFIVILGNNPETQKFWNPNMKKQRPTCLRLRLFTITLLYLYHFVCEIYAIKWFFSRLLGRPMMISKHRTNNCCNKSQRGMTTI